MNQSGNKYTLLPIVLSIFIVLIFVGMVLAYNYYYPIQIGLEQPIPFSHRVHAGEKNISCVMCHAGVIKTARAGIPPVETCLLCHSHIIIHYPYIEKLRAHYFNREPILWEQVYILPE